MKNVPPSWEKMSGHEKACYLVNAHRARDYAGARKMLWNDAKQGVAAFTPKVSFWYNRGNMA